MKEIEPQQRGEWCGPASLVAALKEQGINTIQYEVSLRAHTTQEWGTTHRGLIYAAASFGVIVRALHEASVDLLDAYKRDGYSVIVNWMSGPNINDDGHYSLFDNGDGDTVVICDPADGRIKIFNRQDFEDRWFDIDERGVRVRQWALVIKNLKKQPG